MGVYRKAVCEGLVDSVETEAGNLRMHLSFYFPQPCTLCRMNYGRGDRGICPGGIRYSTLIQI